MKLPFEIKTVEEAYANNENEKDGYYPVGIGNFWHSGIHIHGTEMALIPVLVPGKVVAYRMSKEYTKANLPERITGEEYKESFSKYEDRYEQDKGCYEGVYKLKEGLEADKKKYEISNNFILLKHTIRVKQLIKKLEFYTLYMNLAPISAIGTNIYGEKIKTDGKIYVLQENEEITIKEIGKCGENNGKRYFDLAVVLKEKLFNNKESSGEKKELFHHIPKEITIYEQKKNSEKDKKYYLTYGNKYEIIETCESGNKKAKKIKLTEVRVYLSSQGMEKGYKEGQSYKIITDSEIWLGNVKIVKGQAEINDEYLVIYKAVREAIEKLIKNQKKVKVEKIIDNGKPGINVNIKENENTKVEFWVKENDTEQFSILGIINENSRSYTVYEKNPLIFDYEKKEVSEEELLEVRGIEQTGYIGLNDKKYYKVAGKEWYVSEKEKSKCMESAYEWDKWFIEYEEKMGDSEDILCDRTSVYERIIKCYEELRKKNRLLTLQLEIWWFGKKILTEQIARIFGRAEEKYKFADQVRTEMRKVICKHPIEWDKKKFEGIKKTYNKKVWLGEMSEICGKKLEEVAALTDLWEGGLEKIFGENNLHFAHPIYFLNHLEKAGAFEFNPYEGETIKPRHPDCTDLGTHKDFKMINNSSPGFAPGIQVKTEKHPYEYNGKYWADINFEFGDCPGYSKENTHIGVDFAGEEGTPIYSFISGTVWACTYENSVKNTQGTSGRGRMMVIKGYNNRLYLLCHLSAYGEGIENGSEINPGDLVAKVGNTGNSGGAHLHLEVYVCEFGNDNKAKEKVLDVAKNKQHGQGTGFAWGRDFKQENKFLTYRKNPFNHN